MMHSKTAVFSAFPLAVMCLVKIGSPQENYQPQDVEAVRRLCRSEMELQVRIVKADSSKEKARLRAQLDRKRKQLPRELMGVAEKYPNTIGGLAALYWASFLSSEPATSESASELFKEHALAADLDELASAISLGRRGTHEAGGDLGIARVLLKQVAESANHAKAAELLMCVCRLAKDGSRSQANEVFVKAAEMIVSHHATSPDIANFCEILGNGFGSPAWARPFERHLRVILKANRHRHVRCTGSFALASVVALHQDRRYEESAQLYRQFLHDFDGEHEYHFQAIERTYRRYALRELADREVVGVGRRALETVGVDLDGKSMSLSDYKGKVVLLSFWASWCSPCIEFIPHEQEIARRFKGKPFAIVGVNGDTDVDSARLAAATYGMSWRSFRDKDSNDRKISETWKLSGWPTKFLIDAEGTIRRRWRNVSHEEIGEAIAQLVKKTPGSEE